MSEEESGSGRKGFVRDVMRRISPAGTPRAAGESDETLGQGEHGYAGEVENLQDAIRFFGSDSAEFRHRLDRLLARTGSVEHQRYLLQ